jgi:hypothetical protein
MESARLESESTAVAIRKDNAIIPATEYRNERGYMPETVEYRSKALPLKQVSDGSPEHTQFLRIMDELPSYMGVRDALTTEQIIVTSAFIRDEFGHLNIMEIVRAFKMVAAGKLYATIEASQEGASAAQLRAVSDGQLVKVTAQTFNQWSLPYVGKVLNAYSEMRQRETHEWAKETESKRLKMVEQKPQNYTPEEVLEYIRDFIDRTGEVPLFCEWDKAFFALEDSGDIVMSVKAKQEYADEVVKDEKKRLVGMPLNTQRDRMKSFSEPSKLKSECRKGLVIAWITQQYPKAKHVYPTNYPKAKLK